jgi:hypothetical protein
MHHPLRYIVPPLIVIIVAIAVYLPIRNHEAAVRRNPHHEHKRPYGHVTAAGFIAVALIIAFIAAFILP